MKTLIVVLAVLLAIGGLVVVIAGSAAVMAIVLPRLSQARDTGVLKTETQSVGVTHHCRCETSAW